MKIPDALKRLRKKLKRRRGWMLAAAAAVIIAGLAATVLRPGDSTASSAGSVPALAGESPRPVVLHKRFVCGEEHESLGAFHSEEIGLLRRDHPDWRLEKADENGYVFFVEVADLSAACKENASFGLDRSGYLVLYEGEPDSGKAVRAYFQIDLEKLRASLPEDAVNELRQGIRVTDYAEFNSVLSTYSDFAAS